MASPLSKLPDDLIRELFLSLLTVEDPTCFLRISLTDKNCHRILAHPDFHHLLQQVLPPTPRVLGFLNNAKGGDGYSSNSTTFASNFTVNDPTSGRPASRGRDHPGLRVLDSRHSRVLLSSSVLLSHANLAVWDPISGDRLDLPKLPAPQSLIDRIWIRWNAAVLCASNPSCACDGIDCQLGHFLVVLMATSRHRAYVYVYSSQAATWSEPTSAALDTLEYLMPLELSALAGNSLYFKLSTRLSSGGILKYDLGMQEISWINLPSNCSASEIFFTTTEYGGLGVAIMESLRLHLWWLGEAGPGGHLGWAASRVIELNTVLPANTKSIRVIAFLHGIGAIFVSTNDAVFCVDLESDRARKISEESCGVTVVPYICFCTPAPDVAPYYRGGTSSKCTSA